MASNEEIPANGEDASRDLVVPEVVKEPRRGTLAWVELQGVTQFKGEDVPASHRIPADATLVEWDGTSTKCRVVQASGQRCRAAAAKALGLCMGHAGGGGSADLEEMRAKARASQARLKATRQMLGIGPARSAEPRAAARIRAALRADDLARAIVDGPLDSDLDPAAKQRAALAAVDATFPLQLVTAELSLDDVDSMDWKSMQRVALSLLG